MPLIDIVTMRGMVLRVADHLLPDDVATWAQDCHFDNGVITALQSDGTTDITLPITPVTLFHYYGPHWFTWNREVEVMRSPIAQDQYNRVYFTDGDYPKLTYDAIATGGDQQPVAWFRLGVPAPATPPNMQQITPPEGATDEDAVDDDTRYYVETYVTGLGEEGPPGGPSGKVTVTIPGSTVEVGLSAPPTNDNNIQQRRLYRSVSGGGIADYLLVAELPIATVSYSDIKQDGELGPVLETYDYTMPPEGMRGICQMANGISAGFVGNAVLFSEPFLPYAWPGKYKLTTEHEIVAVVAIDTALVAVTRGYPYLFQGVSPAAMTGQKLSHLQQACVSAHSLVALDGVVLYASPDGLVGVGIDGGQVVTEGIITRAQWQVLQPETLRAWYHEGRYVALTASHGFIFDPKSGDFRWLSSRWDAAVADMQRDTLMLAKGTQLYQWRAGEIPLEMYWRSKVFVLPPGGRLGCARVTSDEPDKVSFTLIVDGEPVFVLAVGQVPASAFRLPALRGTHWQVAVGGTTSVARITLGGSMAEVSLS